VRRMTRCQAYKAGVERRLELNLRTTACPAAVLTLTLAPVRTTRQEQESSTLYTTQAVWEGGAISNKGGSVGQGPHHHPGQTEEPVLDAAEQTEVWLEEGPRCSPGHTIEAA